MKRKIRRQAKKLAVNVQRGQLFSVDSVTSAVYAAMGELYNAKTSVRPSEVLNEAKRWTGRYPWRRALMRRKGTPAALHLLGE